ncbi:MAG: NAD(P)H-hydrate dehydratase [Paracoccaceae bacterium]|nr:NAD(P)H-hydrate dehydratase [Paracoccaceae bacterium]
MPDLLSSAQMRAIEQAAIASGTVTGRELMERAGRAAIDAALAFWPDLAVAPGRVTVFCGPGNNGGDGFVIARLLADRGWQVAVFLYGTPGQLPPDAAQNRDRWLARGQAVSLGFPALDPGATAAAIASAQGADLVVDALFGTGLTRPLAALAPLLSALPRQRTLAVDLPSGLCADSGRPLATPEGATPVLRADLTVAFHAAKRGHYLARGPELCGALRIADIGLSSWSQISPPEAPAGGAGRLRLIEQPAGLGKGGGHKYSHGHALVLSGGPGQGGAARLAARGALRVGAGLVTLACPPAALTENAAQLTAIMLRPVKDAEALAGVLEDTRITALCLGPGMGVPRAAALLPAVLEVRRPTVIDADALTALAGTPELAGALHDRCVLTPHLGEFNRLFPDLAARLAALPIEGPAVSRADVVAEAALRLGCTVLLKGPDTVIAAPDGTLSLHGAAYDRAAPWLATAGSGDVLAGFIAGLLARGLSPHAASAAAAWLHAETARSFGPGLIAEDLPESLPAVFRAMGL